MNERCDLNWARNRKAYLTVIIMAHHWSEDERQRAMSELRPGFEERINPLHTLDRSRSV